VKLCSQLAQTGNLMPRPQSGVRLSMDRAADAGCKNWESWHSDYCGRCRKDLIQVMIKLQPVHQKWQFPGSIASPIARSCYERVSEATWSRNATLGG